MQEGTIYQEQNPTVQSTVAVSQQPTVRFPIRRLAKLIAILIIIPIVLFVILNIILPQFKNPSEKAVTLSYWGIREDPGTMAGVISDFEKENPDIKVVYSKQDPTDYREKLTTRIQNGTGPDIFKFHNTWYPMFSAELLPLPQETIEKKQFLDNYYEVAQKDLIKDGAIYAVPLEIDTLALYVNKQIFEDTPIPVTWQEFIDVSTKLTKRDENGRISTAGAALGTFDNVVHAPDIISLLFAQNGVDLTNPSEYSDKISDALRFYTNFALIETNVWDTTLDPSISAFSQGKVAMVFGYYWDYFEIKKTNPNLAFKIAPVPQLLTSSKFNIASYWADGVSAMSKNQKEALLFMKFLAKKETTEKLYQEQSKVRTLGHPYGNKNLADKLKDTENFVFVDQAKTAVSSPFVDNTHDNGLNDKLNNVLRESIKELLNNGNLESATRSLLEGYSSVIGEYAPIP